MLTQVAPIRTQPLKTLLQPGKLMLRIRRGDGEYFRARNNLNPKEVGKVLEGSSIEDIGLKGFGAGMVACFLPKEY